MKKILALTLVLTFSASAAFAAYSEGYSKADSTKTVGDAPNTLVFKLSKNVQMDYKAHNLKTGYAIAAYHNKGTKTYGSSSGDSKIFENSALSVEAPTAPDGTASADFPSSAGWSAL